MDFADLPLSLGNYHCYPLQLKSYWWIRVIIKLGITYHWEFTDNPGSYAQHWIYCASDFRSPVTDISHCEWTTPHMGCWSGVICSILVDVLSFGFRFSGTLTCWRMSWHQEPTCFWMLYSTWMVANDLVTNRCQAICNHLADSKTISVSGIISHCRGIVLLS